MTELLTAAQMRALEQAAITSGAVTGLQLMERAGQGVVAAILAEWPAFTLRPGRAVVLCGPGNNGGDGFVVARLLWERGWTVACYLYGDPDRLPPDARASHDRWRERGDLVRIDGPDAGQNELRLHADAMGAEVFVDALFGIGLNRPAPRIAMVDQLMHAIFEDGLWRAGALMRPCVVAVDVPSNLSADTGAFLWGDTADDGPHEFWAAHLTVTFHRAKTGHYLGEGPRLCGKLAVADIGLGPRSQGRLAPDPATVHLAERRPDFRDNADLRKQPAGFKFNHGHALVLSGPAGRGGAARLAARGALRIGAGLVTVGCPSEALAEHAARLDAVMVASMDSPAALAERLDDKRITALVIGPGLGLGPEAAALVAAVLDDRRRHPLPTGGPTIATRDTWFSRAVVLDADALTLIARDPALFAGLHDRCVLTPHGGEFARLFPDLAERLAKGAGSYSKVDATRAAAARAGCTVLSKGADSVIADPGGRVAISAAAYGREAPWLATAGSGDVLAGFIAGLLARGHSPFQAARTAAWLHVECARSCGPGLIAEDLPERLPDVFRALEL